MTDRVAEPATHSPARAAATADVVIVNWNAGDLLRRCVESVRDHQAGHVSKVVVVDNGSVDGSDRLEVSGVPLEIVRTGTNLGFGAACNIGVRRGQAPYILFLNPDAALLPETLSTAIGFMERPENARVGVCGIKLIEDDGTVQRHCANFPTPGMFLAAASGLTALLPSRVTTLHATDFDHLSSRPVDHVIGAFYLIRRDLFEQLGGFDERFFVYLEDLDLSARVHAAGYSIFYLAEAVAMHRGGGTSDQVKPQRLAYVLESRIAYAFKHFGRASATAVAAATLFGGLVPRLARAAAHRSGSEARDTLRGFVLLWHRTARQMLRCAPTRGKPAA
ncbi:glycosyltransferase family 2 protein [Sphingomonas sp. DC1600-2]|jgi:N-acetylglucosaminyl-diphospho-decaprenol L-rhamnosyltransferase